MWLYVIECQADGGMSDGMSADLNPIKNLVQGHLKFKFRNKKKHE